MNHADLQRLLSVLLQDDAKKDSWRDWTFKLKREFVAEGNRLHKYVCSSGASECAWGEWLYDVTWLEMHDDFVTRVHLALESEWGNSGDIYDDFVKLLASRADHKVLVFQAKSEASKEEIVSNLQRGIDLFQQSPKNDEVLYACYVRNEFITGVVRKSR